DGEGRTLAIRIVPAKNFPTMFFHDSIADTQAQARALADLLGGEERIKNAVRLTDSRTVVPESYFDVVILAGGCDLNARSLSLFPHRVISVVQNVQEYLLQLAREAEQVLYDLLGALRLLQNHPQVFPGALRHLSIFHKQVCEAQNRG